VSDSKQPDRHKGETKVKIVGRMSRDELAKLQRAGAVKAPPRATRRTK